MSEVVVRIAENELLDSSMLSSALDAFAKWTEQAGLDASADDAPDIMMMTEHSGGSLQRKLIFQSRDHAARFMIFWRQQIHQTRPANDVA